MGEEDHLKTLKRLRKMILQNDPNLHANPVGGVVVMFLEHPDSEKPENDTGEVGNDTIPYTYTRTLNHTFCWEDGDGDAEHFMELVDSEGNEILRIDVNGECVTVIIEAGDYVMIINHDGRKEKTHPIFIIPGCSGEQEAQKIDTNEGLLKSARNIYAKIINNLHNIITQEAKAQNDTTGTPSANITTLIRTNACEECNLAGVDLRGEDLSSMDLFGADLRGAFLNAANLFGANLTSVTLGNTNFNSATWCDGCPCGPNQSIDTCIACPSIDICV